MGNKKIRVDDVPDIFGEDENPKVYSYAEDLKREDLNRGVLYLFGGINDLCANLFSMEANHVLRNKNLKAITIEINSPGGEVYSALSIYNVIESLKHSGIKVTTLVNGLAASAAAMILLQAGSRRVARRNARLLLHEPRRLVYMDTMTNSNLKDEAKAMDAVCDLLYDILAEKMGKTKAEISKLVDRKELWLSAEESLELKLIDEILE